MKKTMSIWVFLSILTFMIVSFFFLKGKLEPLNEALEQKLNGAKAEQSDLQTEETKLKDELSICTSDSYIEKTVRELYGYMSEDEFRIIIVNPELLYDDGIVPDRSISQ